MKARARSRTCYNAAAFADAAAGADDRSDATSRRWAVRAPRSTGPGLKQVDFGLAKSFNVSGQRRVEFRIETFNLTNTPAFELPPNASLDYRDARNFASDQPHAQHAAADAARPEVLLVGVANWIVRYASGTCS